MAMLTTLLSFNGANGTNPYSGLIADAAGGLFGTTAFGGASGDGTVFELVNNGGAYTPVTLLNFNVARYKLHRVAANSGAINQFVTPNSTSAARSSCDCATRQLNWTPLVGPWVVGFKVQSRLPLSFKN